MKLTAHEIRDLVTEAQYNSLTRHHAQKLLRERGYKFGNATFRTLWDEFGGPVGNQGPKAAGVPITNTTTTAVEKPVAGGVIVAPDVVRKKLQGRRFVVTVAQNNTKVHPQFWETLNAFATKQKATMLVGRISYNKAAYSGITRAGSSNEGTDIWYDPVLEPYFISEQIKIAPRLVVCGELDIIPTAINPLGGLDDYTGPNCGIVPHTRLAMKSLATMKHEQPKFMYTTGAVTMRNYIDRRAGQLASFHHVYGALYVEVNEDGTWFVRQINAADDGSFYDNGVLYSGKVESLGVRPRVAVLGDIHIEKGDAVALSTTLGMLSEINPEFIIIHDIIDFTNRNHHNKRDVHFLAKMHFQGQDYVERSFHQAATFLKTIQMVSPRSNIVVIKSNHDEAYDLWVREGSTYPDAANARFWHESNAHVYGAIERKEHPNVFNWAMRKHTQSVGVNHDRVVFLEADDSFIVDGIQYGMHGHLGANGARGGPRAFKQMGIRSTTAHSHAAGITDGNHTVGVLGKLDMGYNRGLSSWSHTNGLTWPNAKRQLITLQGHEWRGKELE
jgi:hypothetical protein